MIKVSKGDLVSHVTLFSRCYMSSHDKLNDIGSHLSQKLYGHQTFKVQGLKLMAPGYQVILTHDCKITWQIKKSNKDSDFYSTTVSLRLSNLARRRPTVNCEVTNMLSILQRFSSYKFIPQRFVEKLAIIFLMYFAWKSLPWYFI